MKTEDVVGNCLYKVGTIYSGKDGVLYTVGRSIGATTEGKYAAWVLNQNYVDRAPEQPVARGKTHELLLGNLVQYVQKRLKKGVTNEQATHS